MARIRTIKPELWTDERLTECSLSARLLFIGMLNFSDDNGNQSYSAKRLKMQIFPADAIDTQPLIDELLTHGLLIEYSVNNEKYLHIKGFRKHQVINRPSSSSIPLPKFTDDSVSPQTPLIDGREGKGKEVNLLSEKSDEKDIPKPKTPKPKNSETPESFENFWSQWPATDRKTGKLPCLNLWKSKKLEECSDQILAHISAAKETKKWRDGYEPAPLTFLKQRHWEDGETDTRPVWER